MTTVEVFDPPMCCSTGVCGPSVDPALATFAADLRWAGEKGATVMRYNLAQEPGRFAVHDEVRGLLAEGGEDVLPVVVVDGQVRSSGRFPARSELAAWALPGAAAGMLDEVTAAGACCGGEVPVAAAARASGRVADLTLIEVAAPCCGGGTAEEGSAEAGQAGCCG